MALTKEEIEAIANKAAERVVSKHSICDCGFFAWHRKTDFDILEQATNTQNAEWVKLTVPHVKEAIGDLEQACRVDLAEAKLKLENYDDFVKSAAWDKARAAALAIKGEVSDQLYLCSKGEEGWVYVKVSTTEVRGRKVPTGIEIGQVSPSFNQDDFDKAVKIIEGKLKGEEE